MKEKQADPIKTFRAQWAVMTFYERFEQVIALALSAIIAVIIVVSLLQLISIVFSLLIIDAFNPLDHKVFQTVFGMIMTLLIAMEFKHSIVRVALRRDSIIQVKTVILIGLARHWPSGRLTGCCASAMTGQPGKAQMISRDLRHAQNVGARHRWLNRLQTALLVLTLLGIAAVAGSLLLGDGGLWLALAAAGFTLLLEPAAASGLTLRLYGARPLHPGCVARNWRRGPGCLPCRYRTTCPAGSSTPSPPVRSITRPSR